MGYSWGNVPALQYAYKNAKYVKGIIMVSPYLFPSKKASMKLLFSLPLASKIIFRFLGNKIITSLLVKSSRPQKVPFIYKRLRKILSQPQMISTAVKEKQAIDVKILQELASYDIPILLVWGEKDATIKEDEQIDPMRRWIKNLKEIRLKNVGHALPFTSPKSLADSINTFIKEKRL